MKHTPGPWRLIDDNEKYLTVTDADQDFGICILYDISSSSREAMLANAQLITAAPEMLIAIKRYLSIAKREGWYATASTLEKLIAKATGEK